MDECHEDEGRDKRMRPIRWREGLCESSGSGLLVWLDILLCDVQNAPHQPALLCLCNEWRDQTRPDDVDGGVDWPGTTGLETGKFQVLLTRTIGWP
jgi:hypothetical protein